MAPAPPGLPDSAAAPPPPAALVIRGGYVLTMDPAAGDLPAAGGPPTAQGQIATLAAGRLLGPDLQVVHANCATGGEVAALAATGTRVSISPHSELLIGYGFPRTAELLAAGIGVGLSVDSTVLTGELTTIDLPQVRSEAQRALAGLRARVGG